MHPLAILLIGVVIVVGGVLLFRLHAFLALVLAALVVGWLTPQATVNRYWIQDRQVKVVARGEDGEPILLKTKAESAALVGVRYLVLRPNDHPLVETERRRYADRALARYNTNHNDVLEKDEWLAFRLLGGADADHDGTLTRAELVAWQPSLLPVGQLEITGFQKHKDPHGDEQTVAVAAAVGPDFSNALSERDIVIHPLALHAAGNAAQDTVGERVADAFGDTCGKIGILIALAAIIGKCLLDSGAADRIVRSALKVVGQRGAPVAFIASGFLLGVPVFFDTVFYLMIPLGKALRIRTGHSYVLYVLTIVAGASMAHSLVPPTPGPLLVAEELGIDIGVMIIGGTIVGLFTSGSALFYARFMNKRFELPLRESPDFSLADIEAIARREASTLPPLWISLLPIVLPVVCIAGFTIIKSFALLPPDSPLLPIAATLGNKNIALAIATVIAMATLVRQKRTNLKDLSGSIQAALASGGVIILITAGGGAFGAMLQQTGVAGLIDNLGQFAPQIVVLLAFLVTTAIRTAQGSATVAMITAVGILSGFADGGLDCHPVYLALAIGCGSKPVAWMNDSGFWVICKMSGMTEGEGLRFVTPMSILMGVVGLAVTILGVTVLPYPFG